MNAPLQTGFCPHIHFSVQGVGPPLTVGDYYLLILVNGTTDYTAANADFDFDHFAGYTQATG